MGKIYALARALALVVAIAAAFVTVPQVAAILLLLGAVAAIGQSDEENAKLFLVAIVLTVGSQALLALPTVGAPLSTIFGGLGTAAIGAAAMAIGLGAVNRLKTDWA